MHRPRTLRSRLFIVVRRRDPARHPDERPRRHLARGPSRSPAPRPWRTTSAARLAATWDEPEAARGVRRRGARRHRLRRAPRARPAQACRRASTPPQRRRHRPSCPTTRSTSSSPSCATASWSGALEMEQVRPAAARRGPGGASCSRSSSSGRVLSVMAGRVANQLARPLERLAHGGRSLRRRRSRLPRRLAGARRWVALEVRDVAVRFNRMADRVEAHGARSARAARRHQSRAALAARARARRARDRARPVARRPQDDRPAAARSTTSRSSSAPSTPSSGDLLDVTRAGLADLRKENRPVRALAPRAIAEEPSPPVDLARGRRLTRRTLALSFDGPLLGRAVHNLRVNATRARAPGRPPARGAASARSGDTRRASSCATTVRASPRASPSRAFEPFVRGDAARVSTHDGGRLLGLGLDHRAPRRRGARRAASSPATRRRQAAAGREVGFDLPSHQAPSMKSASLSGEAHAHLVQAPRLGSSASLGAICSSSTWASSTSGPSRRTIPCCRPRSSPP